MACAERSLVLSTAETRNCNCQPSLIPRLLPIGSESNFQKSSAEDDRMVAFLKIPVLVRYAHLKKLHDVLLKTGIAQLFHTFLYLTVSLLTSFVAFALWFSRIRNSANNYTRENFSTTTDWLYRCMVKQRFGRYCYNIVTESSWRPFIIGAKLSHVPRSLYIHSQRGQPTMTSRQKRILRQRLANLTPAELISQAEAAIASTTKTLSEESN